MTPAQFFANPPWAEGRGGIRMGLRPIAPAGWVPERITPDQRAEKERLLHQHRDVVLRVEPGSLHAQRLLAEAVREATGSALDQGSTEQPSLAHSPAADSTSRDSADEGMVPPIEAAALLVPDDLCLMQRRGEQFRLIAACVCAPSYWKLGDKVGHALADIHERVPTLNERIGQQMQRFFESLPNGSVFERRNWSIHPTEKLYQPEYDGWMRVDSFDALYARSERQTLRRLDAETIAFTILVTCVPLADIRRFPLAAAQLATALDRLNAADRDNMGYDRFADRLRALL